MNEERLAKIKDILSHELGKFRELILMMASLTDRNLNIALNACMERNADKAAIVIAEDSQVDRLEVEVDELVYTYLATKAPVATACRMMIASSKMASALERISDQAVAVARRTRRMSPKAPIPPADLAKMGSIAVQMVRDSIDCFVECSIDKAMATIRQDKEVDALNRRLEAFLTSEMANTPELSEDLLNYIVIARALERAADHAKAIAEEAHFLYTAQDIRHEVNPAVQD